MSEDKSFVKRLLTETWPAKMAKDALSALMLPGDVYQGKVSMYGDDGRTNPEVINRSADLAGLVTLGAGAVPAEANSLRSGIKAYHGSPHDFDRFDLSKIGTGEGAQAYGHGLYFAENEGVARGYRDRISGAQWIDNRGVPVQTNDLVEDISKEARKSGLGVVQADQMAFNWRDYVDNLASAPDPIKKVLEQRGLGLKSNGSMYEVNINADPNALLPWDQSIAYLGKTKNEELLSRMEGVVPPEKKGRFEHEKLAGLTGEKFYKDILGANVRHKAPEITRQLVEAGIPGIKYLDQGSRYAGGGTSNYVVFDDKLIDILRKYGLAGASASPLAALMASQSQGELQQ